MGVNSLNDACFNSPISDPPDQEQEVKAQIHYDEGIIGVTIYKCKRFVVLV